MQHFDESTFFPSYVWILKYSKQKKYCLKKCCFFNNESEGYMYWKLTEDVILIQSLKFFYCLRI